MACWKGILIIICVLLIPGCAPDDKISMTTHESNGPFLMVGADATVITPEVRETWTDIDSDSKYSPDKGDTYFDNNANGQFDAVWLAGFENARPAQGVHDELWVRTVILEYEGRRIAIVAVDLIGLGYNNVEEIRSLVPASLNIDYLVITSIHTHSGPDTIGIWGKDEKSSGFDPIYMEFVKHQAVISIIRATKRLQPAKMFVNMKNGQTQGVIKDGRLPLVIDDTIGILHFTTITGETIATIVNWSNHPDALGERFLKVSSDYPHLLRSIIEERLGGIAFYITGAIGGQIEPTFPPDSLETLKNRIESNPFLPAELLGEYIGKLALEMVTSEEEVSVSGISVNTQMIEMPLHNPLFQAASAIGIIHRKPHAGKIRSEVSVITIGSVQILCIPGEIYPEIIIGGIVSLSGSDFPGKPLEVPPLKSLMKGKYNFIFGLTNDEIGYIIPKTEWDEKPPFLYDRTSPPYGEVNSVGPDAAWIIHHALSELLE